MNPDRRQRTLRLPQRAGLRTSPRHTLHLAPFLALLALAAGAPLPGCGDEIDQTGYPDGSQFQATLVVGNISLDFLTGTLGLMDSDRLTAMPDVTAIHSDHILRAFGDSLFVINRMGADNIQRLDPQTFATRWQYSTEAGSNPYDLALVDETKGYVPLYDRAALLVVNPSASGADQFVRTTIDLGRFADDDGLPEANAVGIIGDRVYLTLQRLDRNNFFAPTGQSYLVAIDTATDAVVPLSTQTDHLVIPYSNPMFLRVADDQLWIGCAGSYGANDGAIVPFDPATATFLDPLVTEEALGGDLGPFTATNPIYLLWTDSSFTGHLAAVDPESGQVTPILSGFQTSQDLEADDTYIYVADRSQTAAGVRVFRRSDLSEVTESPISTGLPPWELELFDSVFQTE
ncbi:MAG: PQQ-like beta-propeller repeat protein [Bradymonadales bacterium]|nr:PQQ-like beta-propeller repeat protein [Bradymonadales bacterium]